MIKIYKILAFGFLIMMSGCSSDKEIEEFNKPATYWYSKVVESVAKNNLDKADAYFTSLQSEHTGSPMLKEATIILALAHMKQDEYILAEHFLDEYIKRYASTKEQENASFLKVKSRYLALPHTGRDQAMLDEAIESANGFLTSYPTSEYKHMVDTMLGRMLMAKFVLNDNIRDLYSRLGKNDASMYYKETNSQQWLNDKEVQKVSPPWYREWFEGDGGASWYDFMVPSGSIVSRNSNKEDVNESR